jgi:hypothetical protein
MIESGLHALITADSRFAKLASDRLYPLLLPEAAALPSATYQLISSVPEYTNDGPTRMVKARVQIDVWSDSYATCKTLTDALRVLLDGFTGTLPNGVAVSNIIRDNSSDYIEPVSRLYRVQTDWLVIYDEQ